MKNKSLIISISVIAGAIGLSVILILAGGKATNQPERNHLGNSAPRPPQTAQIVPDTASLEDNDAVLGNPDAPVTLVEFGDYQCTFCTKFFNETEPTLIDKYVKTGKLKIVFRDLAINGRESQNAAEAAECAGEQEKYWEYHDRLYSERRGYNVGVFKKDNLIKFASDLGLDAEQFSSCYESGKYRQEIAKDSQDAARLGARGTPNFFLNGRQLVGAQPYQVFAGLIDQLLINGGL
ncbi:MAG: DsbA family protein [Candidatus Yanofskybacteria bacterium]|nr:DsbA family protein [Candidatus Yanofskybacteria bacterium]